MDLAIKQNKNGQTKLLVTIPYSQRVGLNRVSKTLGLSQQSLIRSAIAALLEQHKEPEQELMPHKLRVHDRFTPTRSRVANKSAKPRAKKTKTTKTTK
jgi:hypothetical protein